MRLTAKTKKEIVAYAFMTKYVLTQRRNQKVGASKRGAKSSYESALGLNRLDFITTQKVFKVSFASLCLKRAARVGVK